MKYITISEYGHVGCDKKSVTNDNYIGERDLSIAEFNELKEYWEQDEDTFKLFTLVNSNCLKATNYVGIIQTENLSIEVLPKIYNKKGSENSIRTIFIEMLKPLLNINDIQIEKADLSVTKNSNIFEIFITIFVEHMDKFIHKGLKSEYVAREDNQYFLKGKLKFNLHIKKNYIHKERFYVEFDEYLQDRVENRLLKSTIELLLKKTTDYENKRALRQQLFVFDEVRLSTSYDIDFKKVSYHRGMEHYKLPLRFAKVFLKHNSFTSLRGKDNVFALLFPMEKVFENYMEFVLENSKSLLRIKEVHINGQKNEYFLSGQQARLEPDYLLELEDGITQVVTDAKWKLFDTEDSQSGIKFSSGDVYQVFSYLTYYEAMPTAYIFAPKLAGQVEGTCSFEYQDTNGGIGKSIQLVPIDLENMIVNHAFIESFMLDLK